MNTEKLRELGSTWKDLNEKYDAEIVRLIDAPEPEPLSPEKMEELTKLQGVLFKLEGEIYTILESRA